MGVQVLAAKGHRAVMELPRACHLPDLEMLIYQVCPLTLHCCSVQGTRTLVISAGSHLVARPMSEPMH